MKLYEKIKDAIIGAFVAGIYCYSCFTVEGNNVPTVIFATVMMGASAYLIMRALDEKVYDKIKERKKANVLHRQSAPRF